MGLFLRVVVFAFVVLQQHGDSRHTATLLRETSSGRFAWRRLSSYAALKAVIEAARSSYEGLDIPLVLHRSHKYAIPETLVGKKRNPKLKRFRRNLHSCTHLNPDVPTLYYNDDQVLHIIKQVFFERVEGLVQSSSVSPDTLGLLRKAWARLTKDPMLRQPFVLKSDWFRLAIVYLYGKCRRLYMNAHIKISGDC